MRTCALAMLLFGILTAGCGDKKLPAELRDVAEAAGKGELQEVTDVSAGVEHVASHPADVFAVYASVLTGKGWTLAKEIAKHDLSPPSHRGCFERSGKQLSVFAGGPMANKRIGVIVAVGCVGYGGQ